MRIKALKSWIDGDSEDDESFVVNVPVKMNRAARRTLRTKKGRDKLVHLARERGVIRHAGCACYICLQGGDCCGKMVPSFVRVMPTTYGVRLQQFYYRNI